MNTLKDCTNILHVSDWLESTNKLDAFANDKVNILAALQKVYEFGLNEGYTLGNETMRFNIKKLLRTEWVNFQTTLGDIGNHIADDIALLPIQPLTESPDSEQQYKERWNTRAPTPREQELEAQNKALWELVDALAHPYDFDAEEAMFQLKNLYNKSDDESGVFEVDDVTYKIVMINLSLLAEAQKLAAIQKAKEAR
jgi:hypothetical protein